jgi:hypothetical protein
MEAITVLTESGKILVKTSNGSVNLRIINPITDFTILLDTHLGGSNVAPQVATTSAKILDIKTGNGTTKVYFG